VNQSVDAGMDHGADAHEARFEGDVEGRSCEAVVSDGPGRAPHSGHDGGEVRPGEHYANIEPLALARWLNNAGIHNSTIEYRAGACDVYATATRPA